MNKLVFDNNFKYRIFRHLIFFLVAVFLFAAVLFVQDRTFSFSHLLWVTFLNSLFFFGFAYVTIFLLIPEFLLNRKIFWFAVLFLLVGIALSTLKLIVSDEIFYFSISPENVEQTGLITLRLVVVNTKDMTFIVALFCIAKFAKDYIYIENIRKKLEIQNREAQRKLLQSQLQPHFLFNTINNLYALSVLHSEKTKEVVKRIKTVLNYIIVDSQQDLIKVEEEVVLVENYISLEKLRYGNRLHVNFEKQGDFDNIKIPPMILFFLVENCFKHGSSVDVGHPWINILVEVVPGKILLSTENNKAAQHNSPDGKKHKGNGLTNLQKRLDFIYSKNGYQLKIADTGNAFKVNLEIVENAIEIEQHNFR